MGCVCRSHKDIEQDCFHMGCVCRSHKGESPSCKALLSVFRRTTLPVAIAVPQLVTYIPLPEERTWEKSSTCSSDGKVEVMEDEEGLVQFLMQSKEIYQTNQHRSEPFQCPILGKEVEAPSFARAHQQLLSKH